MRQRRCQEIANHFIPKHHSKYLMRKNMLNTKFQWLAKYIAQDQNSSPHSLTKLVNVQQKQTFQPEERAKHTFRNKDNSQSVKTEPLHYVENQQAKTGKSYLFSTFSSHLNGKSKARAETEPGQSTLQEKDKTRNKSLMMRRSYHKKTPSFFEKQNRKTFSQKLKPKYLQLSEANLFKRNQQLQSFTLTPWGMGEKNVQSSDFVYE